MARSAIRQGTLGSSTAVRGEVKDLIRSTMTLAAVTLTAVVVVACGESPLGSIGERSSGWINEPEVVTTTLPPVTVPE